MNGAVLSPESGRRIPNALSIAGVDPSGGAGVLADVKAMSALGAYGCAVSAAMTAQNTQGVTGISPVAAGVGGLQAESPVAGGPSDAATPAVNGQWGGDLGMAGKRGCR